MLAKYVSLSTATQAQILADLAALACGATIASLSAGCDKVASAILVNTESSGWTLHDAAGPSSGKVLTAKDMANNDKFVNLYISGANSSFSIYGYDTYNNVTHTGTNQTGAANSPLLFTAGNVQTYFIYATTRNLAIFNTTATVALCSFEFTREAPYLSNNGYPAHCISTYWGFNNAFSLMRIKNYGGNGDFFARQNCGYIQTIGGNNFSGPYRDANDVIVYPIMDAYLVLDGNFNSLPVGKFCDILLSTNNLGTFMDTTLVDDVPYFVVPFGAYARTLFKMV